LTLFLGRGTFVFEVIDYMNFVYAVRYISRNEDLNV